MGTLLRLSVTGGDLVDGPVRSTLTVEDWHTARLDPVADCSAGLVAHLLADHPGELAVLAAEVAVVLPPAVVPPAVVPGGRARLPVLVAIDRTGTRWRCPTSGGAVDARLDFAAPVDGVHGLHAALRELVAAAAAGRGAGPGCGTRGCGGHRERP